jgi:hypothetical protein
VRIVVGRAAVALFLMVSGAANASTFTADFSGQINGGNANVKAPFVGTFAPNDPISGHFVFDSVFVPASGVANVSMSSFPSFPVTPEATAFQFSLGSIQFDLGDNLISQTPLQIQYANGQFNGFIFVGDFAFGGKEYQLRLNGPTVTVKLLNGVPNVFDPNGFPTGSSLINAKINVGDANRSNVRSYNPSAPLAVPLSPSWQLTMLGFAGIGFMVYRRRYRGATLSAA